jgi:bifunctional DNA-binding transcriptional regulator/antitoxin component of YhaV-PrlF toxin-antitoxin module
LVRVDASGAVASKATVKLLGWSRGTPIRFDVRSGLLVVSADTNAGREVPQKLNLVLPTKLRAQCRIRAGDQVLLAALVEHELLVVYPQRKLYDMVIAYHATLRTEPAPSP